MKYSLLKADLEKDGESIIAFWKRNFPTWPAQKFQWFYRDNIYGPADCWLVKTAGSESVVGCAAIFPRKVFHEGQELLAGITGDFGVDLRHRVLGPALRLQRAVAQAGRDGKYEFLYGFPNRRSEPVQKRAGFDIVGNSVRMVRVLRTESYLKRLMWAPLLPSIAGLVADWGIRAIARESRYRLNPQLQIGILHHTDERFDTLWEVARKHFNLIGERNRAFLTWRFANCPFRQYQFFVLWQKKDTSLVGYVVFHIQENVVHISDLLAETPQLLQEVLLPAFLKHVRKSKYDSISVLFLGREQLIGSLKRFHFVCRENDRNIRALPGIGRIAAEEVYNPQNWYFCEADND